MGVRLFGPPLKLHALLMHATTFFSGWIFNAQFCMMGCVDVFLVYTSVDGFFVSDQVDALYTSNRPCTCLNGKSDLARLDSNTMIYQFRVQARPCVRMRGKSAARTHSWQAALLHQ